MKQAIWCKKIRVGHRLSSLVLCLMIILTVCACNDSSVKEPSDKEPNLPVTSLDNSSDEPSVNDTVSVDPISGEIRVSASVEAFEEHEKNTQVPGISSSSFDKGYAENEANTRRNEILNTANTEQIYNIKGTKYYVSLKGDDNNNGLSPATALKSIDAFQKITLHEGDAILFERGYVYRFKHSISIKSGVTYGSYGEGDKPAIYGSPMNYAESVWEPYKKKNVWCTEYLYGSPSGVFFDYGKVVGKLKNVGVGALEQNGDFYHDSASGMIYIYSDKGNPGNVYESIEVSPSTHIFSGTGGVKNVVIDNICIKYGSYGIAANGSENFYVTNCEFGYIGGMAGADVRRGNAIEIMGGPNNNLHFDHNWVYQTFDTAISWQGFSGEGCTYKNISFSDNLLEYNNADFEFWEIKGAILDGFKMNNNIMRFTSKGWGTREDDGGIRGIEGCLKGDISLMTVVGTIDFENNIIDCPGRQIVWLSATSAQRNQFKTYGNSIFIKNTYRTSSEIIRDFPDSLGNKTKATANNLDELKNALSIFDPTAKLAWYE